MSIFAISDLHLAMSAEKPMDIFGEKWQGYMDKLRTGWESTVSADDYVIIPGDISWATYIEDAVSDFNFIDSLPGKKIILKGNHDYWWTTMSKLNKFLDENGFRTISFLHNNSFKTDGVVICGTRGWNCPGDDSFNEEDIKLYERELNRLEISLKSAADGKNADIITALHFPPFNSKKEAGGFIEIMQKHEVKICIYGHLHGEGFKYAVEGNVCGIDFLLVSADYLNFTPLKLF